MDQTIYLFLVCDNILIMCNYLYLGSWMGSIIYTFVVCDNILIMCNYLYKKYFSTTYLYAYLTNHSLNYEPWIWNGFTIHPFSYMFGIWSVFESCAGATYDNSPPNTTLSIIPLYEGPICHFKSYTKSTRVLSFSVSNVLEVQNFLSLYKYF